MLLWHSCFWNSLTWCDIQIDHNLGFEFHFLVELCVTGNSSPQCRCCFACSDRTLSVSTGRAGYQLATTRRAVNRSVCHGFYRSGVCMEVFHWRACLNEERRIISCNIIRILCYCNAVLTLIYCPMIC